MRVGGRGRAIALGAGSIRLYLPDAPEIRVMEFGEEEDPTHLWGEDPMG